MVGTENFTALPARSRLSVAWVVFHSSELMFVASNACKMAGPGPGPGEPYWEESMAQTIAVPGVVPFDEIEGVAPGKPNGVELPVVPAKFGNPLDSGMDFN